MGVMTVIVDLSEKWRKFWASAWRAVRRTTPSSQVGIMLVLVPIGDDLEPPGSETNKENNESQFH